MNKHHGQILEYQIRRNGFNITDLAKKLKVDRRSLYNWFKSEYLRHDIILKIGLIIRHDFSIEIPEHFDQVEFLIKNKVEIHADIVKYKEMYIALLEKYNALLLER